MATNLDLPAQLVMGAYLGALGMLVVLLVATLVCRLMRRPRLAEGTLLMAMAGILLYGSLLLGVSLMSEEKTLARDREKYFCELDCHLAYSVAAVDVVPARAARQERYRVTLRTRFDESTIGPARPRDVPLTANPRRIVVVDEQGREYEPVSITGASLQQPLKPGQSCQTELVFDLPLGVENPRLLVTDAPGDMRLVIGSEISPLHAKTYFELR
jgi:hypothetical protein